MTLQALVGKMSADVQPKCLTVRKLYHYLHVSRTLNDLLSF